MKNPPQTIDEYIRSFPAEVRTVLEKIRETIRQAAPDAVEAVSYRMPAFKLNGTLVYFAAFKDHIGFYPLPAGIKALEAEIKPYVSGKGTLRFPLDQPVPFALIARIVAARARQNRAQQDRSRGLTGRPDSRTNIQR